jgi:DNA polymerase-3 subunit epsilon
MSGNNKKGAITRLSGSPLVFVDIETNGLNHIRGRVIEVAAIRVENGKVTRSFNTLVDPETELPQFITNLTGITTNDVKQAPTFHQIADELQAVIQGAIFVAHNVRFDYSFLKQEYKRLGKPFLPKQLCTVKLSRTLFPDQRGHKLQDLLSRYNFPVKARHRAYDDAQVLWQFIQYIEQTVAVEIIEQAVSRQIQRPALPKGVAPELFKDLPTGPGVYIFEDAEQRPLYVGKSINIRKRVLQHFGNDHSDSKEFKIAQTVQHIRTEQTGGELSALLLESRLVKELQPLYNRQLRRLSKLTVARLVQDKQGYNTVQLEEADMDEVSTRGDIIATFPRRGRAREALDELIRTYQLCPKLMNVEKSNGACFLYQLHKCRGACVGAEPAVQYNLRMLQAFERRRIQAWPFNGPVLVQEQSNDSGIIVDQWCVVAEVKQEAYCEPEIVNRSRVFDLDTYKILQTFLTSKLQGLKIQPLTSQQLGELGV